MLSPAAYVVCKTQREELERLSRAVYTHVEALARKLSTLGKSTRLTHEEAFFLGLAKNGIRGLLKPSEHDGNIPPVIKVDLVQDSQGHYKIAEVDVYNPRGFGYLALLDGLVPDGATTAGPGISAIADSMNHFSRDAQWVIVVSEFERYYYPTYSIFANALEQRGLRVSVFRGRELAAGSETLAKISHVFAVPDTFVEHPEVRKLLLSRYRARELSAFYPPAAYLGSKAYLPFLRAQPGLEEFIPPSALVCRRSDPWKMIGRETPVVLKGVMSSGHKQVIFSKREPVTFENTLAEARRSKYPAWMVQEEVAQGPVSVVVFDDAGQRLTRNYFLRLTAYVARDGLIGLEATGRESSFVHGAPDCIQIPAILE